MTLLRHAHVLPFAPLPHTRADADPTARDTMYALLQPVDHISTNVLADISIAHGERAAHRHSVAQHAAGGAAGDPGQQLQAALAAADKPPPPPQPQADAAGDGSAGGQPMKRQRTVEELPAAPQPQEGGVPAAQPAAGQPPAAAAPARPNQYTAFTVHACPLMPPCACRAFSCLPACCMLSHLKSGPVLLAVVIGHRNCPGLRFPVSNVRERCAAVTSGDSSACCMLA